MHGFRFTSITNSIKAFFFRIIEKILSFNTDIFITINNEDYNFAKFQLFKRSLCYKINGVGLNLKINHLKKTIKKKQKIKKIYRYIGSSCDVKKSKNKNRMLW